MIMRRVLVFAVFCTLSLVPFSSFAQESNRSDSAANVENQVEHLNEQLMAAEVKPDVDFVDGILTDDYSHTHANGIVQTKAQFMEGLKSGSHGYALLDISDVRARVYGRTVILEGNVHIKGSNKGKVTAEGHNLFSEVWVRQGGSWRLVQWITLHLPAGPAAESK